MNNICKQQNKMNLIDDLHYYEYVFDSATSSESYADGFSAANYPAFKMENPLNNILGLKVLSVEIPLSFYNINSTNNTFQVNYNSTVNVPVSITPGNYSSTTLAEAVEAALIAVHSQFTVTINTITSKYLISSNQYFTLTFTSIENTLAKFLGFGVGTYASGAGPHTLTPPYVFSVTGDNYLYVNSNKLGSLIQLHLPIENSISRGGFGPQIAKIQITENPYSVVSWVDPNPDTFFNLFNLFQLQNLDFYITKGTSSTPINFNGLGFSLKLGILVAGKEKSLISRDVKRLKI